MASEDDLFGTDLDLTAADLMVIDRKCALSRATPKLSRLDTIHRILKDTFQLSEFRPKQLDVIKAALDDRDVFVRFPTSGGKSLCFQLPAVYELKTRHAVTFVIQPSVELIKNQVAALEKLGIRALIFEPLSRRTGNYWDILVEEISTPFCFLTPHMLQTSAYLKDILTRLYSDKRIARFAIDEAHIVLTEENVFGAAYRELGILRTTYPDVPIMALSATAPPDTVNEIRNRLKMRDVIEFSTSDMRTNLKYSVIFRDGGFLSGIELLEKFLEKYRGKKGLVFCRSINNCCKVAESLQKRSWKVSQYHARFTNKRECLRRFVHHPGDLDILVTTKALGVGVNLPNLKFVAHWEAPYAFSEYLQQSGRAGRDGEPAECVLFFSPHSMSRVPHEERELSKREIQERLNMIKYAMSRHCRQAGYSKYPGPKDGVQCMVCDNCSRKSAFIDITERATVVLKMYKGFPTHPYPTLNQLVDHYLGRNRKTELVESLKMDEYGIGKDPRLRFIDIEFLLMRALLDGIFKEIIVPRRTPSGYYSYAYLEPSPDGWEYLRTTMLYFIDFSPLKPLDV